MKLAPITPGCLAVVIDCNPKRFIGTEVICHYRCKSPPKIVNIRGGGHGLVKMGNGVWYVTFARGGGYGYIAEDYLMRIDGHNGGSGNDRSQRKTLGYRAQKG